MNDDLSKWEWSWQNKGKLLDWRINIINWKHLPELRIPHHIKLVKSICTRLAFIVSILVAIHFTKVHSQNKLSTLLNYFSFLIISLDSEDNSLNSLYGLTVPRARGIFRASFFTTENSKNLYKSQNVTSPPNNALAAIKFDFDLGQWWCGEDDLMTELEFLFNSTTTATHDRSELESRKVSLSFSFSPSQQNIIVQ